MKFKATDEQIGQIATNAVTFSIPMGLGNLHYKDGTKFKPEMFKPDSEGLSLDYVEGRMVKLHLKRVEKDTWEVSGEPNKEYQSWVRQYPTYKDLIESVKGVSIVKVQ